MKAQATNKKKFAVQTDFAENLKNMLNFESNSSTILKT
jgi:hypothetical protein